MKEYTLEDMRQRVSEIKMKPIREEIRWDTYTQKFDGNFSSILTKLIQEAGRLCEAYASDLFISWTTLMNDIESGRAEGIRLFGIRENGVDHASWVLNKLNNRRMYGENPYRALYMVDIVDTGKTRYEHPVYEMTLYRICY